MIGPYDDIIHLPCHVSSTRQQMSIANRAAQFSPFAALTGYEAAIKETARLTDRRMELDENAIAVLDMQLHMLRDTIAGRPMATVTYFQADRKKEGGAYVNATGAVEKIDENIGALVLTSGERIPFADILHIECMLFHQCVSH